MAHFDTVGGGGFKPKEHLTIIKKRNTYLISSARLLSFRDLQIFHSVVYIIIFDIFDSNDTSN